MMADSLDRLEPGRYENCHDLILHDIPPIIVSASYIGCNQSPDAVVQFERWISQYVGHAELSELGADGANDHSSLVYFL